MDLFIKIVDLISKLLLGFAGLFATIYFANIQNKDRNLTNETEMLKLFNQHVVEMSGLPPKSIVSRQIAFYAAKHLNDDHNESRYLEIFGQIDSGSPQSITKQKGDDNAYALAVAEETRTPSTAIARSNLYFAVIASYELDNIEKAKKFQMQALSKIKLKNLNVSIYKTYVSNSYAVVIEDRIGCPLTGSRSQELAEFARTENIAADAFSQRDRNWSLEWPSGFAKGDKC